MQTGEELLNVSGLKTYFSTAQGVVRAVDGVDLTLRRGEALGLLGESGCGKSVFARSLMRLVAPPGKIVAGEIRLKGEDLLTQSESRLRGLRGRELAIVFQDPFTTLNPTQPVGDQIGEPLRVHGLARSRGAVRRRVLELIEAVRLPSPEERYDQYPYELSGGMRQRAIIATALACRPSLLICDEPTTALDVTVQAQILELLGEIRKRRGTAILFITHDIAVAGRLCDRLAVMYAGRLVETGPTPDVLTAPLHPYTQGLLRCVPTLRARRDLQPIPGEVPNPTELPPGCKFHPRCPLAEPRCMAAEPRLFPADETRQVRCARYEGGKPS